MDPFGPGFGVAALQECSVVLFILTALIGRFISASIAGVHSLEELAERQILQLGGVVGDMTELLRSAFIQSEPLHALEREKGTSAAEPSDMFLEVGEEVAWVVDYDACFDRFREFGGKPADDDPDRGRGGTFSVSW